MCAFNLIDKSSVPRFCGFEIKRGYSVVKNFFYASKGLHVQFIL